MMDTLTRCNTVSFPKTDKLLQSNRVRVCTMQLFSPTELYERLKVPYEGFLLP